MFPDILLSNFSQTIPYTDLQTDESNTASFISKMGYTYSIGLNKQMAELHSLSTKIFKEIYDDLVQVGDHFSQLQERVGQLKSKASILENPNFSKDPNHFVEGKYEEFDDHLKIQNQLNRLDTFLIDHDKVKTVSLVKDIIDKLPKIALIDAWDSVIPKEVLEKSISDPNVLITMYIDDIRQQWDELDKNMRKRSERTKSLKNKHNQKSGNEALSIIVDKVLPPPNLLFDPPPRGFKQSIPKIHFITKSEQQNQPLNIQPTSPNQQAQYTQQQQLFQQQLLQQQRQLTERQNQIINGQRQLKQEQDQLQIEKTNLRHQEEQFRIKEQQFSQEKENFRKTQQNNGFNRSSIQINQDQLKREQDNLQLEKNQLRHDQEQLNLQKQQIQEQQNQLNSEKQEFLKLQQQFNEDMKKIQQQQGSLIQTPEVPPPPLSPPPPPPLPPPPPPHPSQQQSAQAPTRLKKIPQPPKKTAQKESDTNFLDLIKNGNFKLKKVTDEDKVKPKIEAKPENLNNMLEALATIRNAWHNDSSSDSSSEYSSSSDTVW